MDICRLVCWCIALGLAALAGWAVVSVIGLSLYVAIIIGLLVFVMLAWGLPLMFCGDAASISESAAPKAAPVAASAPETKSAEPASAPIPAPAAASAAPIAEDVAETATPAAASGTTAHWSSGVNGDSGKASPNRGQSALKPAAAPSEEDTLRDGVGSWRYEGETPAVAPKAAAPKPIEAAPTEEAAPAETASAEMEPETLSGARAGGADDLKRIKGVGPGLEKTLNELGFYHFDQIAAWSAAEVEWVDSRLKFKGRIVRDDWIGQAKTFAASA